MSIKFGSRLAFKSSLFIVVLICAILHRGTYMQIYSALSSKRTRKTASLSRSFSCAAHGDEEEEQQRSEQQQQRRSGRVVRMVNAAKASKYELNYAVAITLHGELICTGGLIDAQYALTAAHCFLDRVNKRVANGPWHVVAGTKNLRESPSANRADVNVEEIYLPREPGFYFKDSTLEADIAIVKVRLSFSLFKRYYVTYSSWFSACLYSRFSTQHLTKSLNNVLT